MKNFAKVQIESCAEGSQPAFFQGTTQIHLKRTRLTGAVNQMDFRRRCKDEQAQPPSAPLTDANACP